MGWVQVLRPEFLFSVFLFKKQRIGYGLTATVSHARESHLAVKCFCYFAVSFTEQAHPPLSLLSKACILHVWRNIMILKYKDLILLFYSQGSIWVFIWLSSRKDMRYNYWSKPVLTWKTLSKLFLCFNGWSQGVQTDAHSEERCWWAVLITALQ